MSSAVAMTLEITLVANVQLGDRLAPRRSLLAMTVPSDSAFRTRVVVPPESTPTKQLDKPPMVSVTFVLDAPDVTGFHNHVLGP